LLIAFPRHLERVTRTFIDHRPHLALGLATPERGTECRPLQQGWRDDAAHPEVRVPTSFRACQ
jgi:hypothetical protein